MHEENKQIHKVYVYHHGLEIMIYDNTDSDSDSDDDDSDNDYRYDVDINQSQ